MPAEECLSVPVALSVLCGRALPAFASFRLARGSGIRSLNGVLKAAPVLCWDAMACDSLAPTEEAVMWYEWRDLGNVLEDVLRYE